MLELTDALTDVVASTSLIEQVENIVCDICGVGCGGHFYTSIDGKLYLYFTTEKCAEEREKLRVEESIWQVSYYSHRLRKCPASNIAPPTRGCLP